MDKIPLVDLVAQYKSIKTEIDASVYAVIESAEFINGEENRKFEEEFARYCGVKYCVSVGSGSVALDFSIEALGLGEEDEVICPSHTFTATAEAIVHAGVKPVFVDIDEFTYNIDPKLVEKKVTRRTKAIVVVHLYGMPADMSALRRIARKYGLYLIEDAAQAHGAFYRGRMAGSLGDIACFSFFPAKNLGCFGDGGAVVTNNKSLADKVRLLRDHGRREKYEHLQVGYGGRLDNLQAAVLRVKLKYLDEWNEARRRVASNYNERLEGAYVTPFVPSGVVPVYYVYTLRYKRRDKVMKLLGEKGISVGIYYPVPLHLQRAYKYLGYKKGDLVITERVCREIFSIPMFPELKKRQIEKITDALLLIDKSLR